MKKRYTLSSKVYWRSLGLVGLFTVLVAVGVQPTTGAQAQSSDELASAESAAAPIAPTRKLKVGRAVLRTWAEIAAAESTRPPLAPAETPFRSTLGDAAYAAAKAAASSVPRSVKLSAPELLGPPIYKGISFEGVNQSETPPFFRPPDTHGAIGTSHFVEVTNTHLDIYSRDGIRVVSTSLAAFFGYFTKAIFDPRAVYDPIWNRWVITGDSFAESPTVQNFLMAISKTSDPTGPYFVYIFNVTFASGDFFDFPQLGFDQDAVIITANIFNGTSFKGADLFAVAKARLYNGLSFSVPIFTGLVGTLAPPIVLDQNRNAFLVAAPPGGSTVTKYNLTNASNASGATLVSSTITVPAYAIPPNAPQPTVGACNATTNLLDTSDARFVNASTQTGSSLFQVHTVALGSFAAPRFYEFNTITNAVVQSGAFFASGTSFDWNASIAATTVGNVFVTWTSDFASATAPGTPVQVRFSGRLAGDPAGVIGAGFLLSTSPLACYNPSTDNVERWGDYSAVSIDPLSSLRAWGVNEKILSSTVWSTRIGNMGY